MVLLAIKPYQCAILWGCFMYLDNEKKEIGMTGNIFYKQLKNVVSETAGYGAD